MSYITLKQNSVDNEKRKYALSQLVGRICSGVTERLAGNLRSGQEVAKVSVESSAAGPGEWVLDVKISLDVDAGEAFQGEVVYEDQIHVSLKAGERRSEFVGTVRVADTRSVAEVAGVVDVSSEPPMATVHRRLYAPMLNEVTDRVVERVMDASVTRWPG